MASTIIKVKLIMYERQSVNSLLRNDEWFFFFSIPCKQILLRGYMLMQYRIRKPYLYSGAKEIAFCLGYKEGYAFIV